MVKTVPTPQPNDSQVLIKVAASGVCYSDHFAVEGMMGTQFPYTPGHEVVGHLVAKGKGVSDEYKEGSLVGLGWNGGYCHQCDACRKGEFYACHSFQVTGVTAPTGGGHQEYVLAHWTAVVKLPENTGISVNEMAPLLCAGLTVNDALRHGNAKAGDVVLIQGIGGLGHLALQFARKAGFHVVAVSGSESKRDLALQLGAHDYYAAKDVEKIKEKYGGAKLAVATAPSAASIGPLVPLLARNGDLVIVGVPTDGKQIEVDPMALVQGRLNVRGLTCGCSINNEDLVKFAALGDHKVKAMVQTYKLDDADKAYQEVVKGNPKFRNVIVFE